MRPEDFETDTGASFAVYDTWYLDEGGRVVYLIDLAEPGKSPGLSVHDRPEEVCAEINNIWPRYLIAYRDSRKEWKEMVYFGGKGTETPIKFHSFCSWKKSTPPSDKEISDWIERRLDRENSLLLTASQAAVLLGCAMKLVNDISAGKLSNGALSTTELSAKILEPVSESLAELHWDDVEAMKVARKKIGKICKSEPDLLQDYEALLLFGRG